MAYWKAEVYDANFTKRAELTGSTKKELRHEFVKWKKKKGIPINSGDYWLANERWIDYW